MMGISLLQGIKLLIPLILLLTVHEWAHAYSAYRLGDDTAARQGRMTLNPIPHIDLIGTILCPMLGIPFGWAKPVPVNVANFRRDVSMSMGNIITSAAGPLSNLGLAILSAVLYGLLVRFRVLSPGIEELLRIMMQLNVALLVFNFIPIPPLDGSRVVDGLMPYRFRPQWEQFVQYSPFILLLVIFFSRSIMNVPMNWVLDHLVRLISLAAGG